MKIKLLLVSLISISLFVIIWFTPLEIHSQVNKYLKTGNEFIEVNDTENASSEYLDGLVLANLKEDSLEKEKSKLNISMGMTMYLSDRYNEVEEYFNDVNSHHLLRGNALYYLSQLDSDPQTKLEILNKALDVYRQGIILDSYDLELKYNYEFVLQELQSEEENQDQEENQESEENQDQEDNQESEENQEENTDSESDNGDSENEDGQDQENQESSQDSEEEEKNQENQDSSQGQEDKSGNQEDQVGPENQDSKGQEGQEEGQGQTIQGDLSEEAYEELLRILELLEQEEEESLKNNQEIIEEGNGDTNDW